MALGERYRDSLFRMRVLIAHNQYRSVGGEERHVISLRKGCAELVSMLRRLEVNSPHREFRLRERLTLGRDSHLQARRRPPHP